MDFDINDNHGKLTIQDEVESTLTKESYLSPKRKAARELAQSKGFRDEYEHAGWIYFNRLNASPLYNGYEVDVLHFADNGGYE